MKTILTRMNVLPMKWRLAVWSSVLIILLFVVYSGVQYLVLDRWALGQEKQELQKNLTDIQGYFTDTEASGLENSRSFLRKVNDNNQMIRILDSAAKPVLTISEHFLPDWVQPKTAASKNIISEWHDDEHLLILRSPFKAGAFSGTIEIAKELENYEKLNHILFIVMVFGGLFGIALGIAGSVLLAGQFVKPIRQLAVTMGRIRQNGLSERVEVSETRDELSGLSQVFNDMMNRLEISFRQQKQFVEDASHELRTPIAIVEGHLKLLDRWGKQDPSVLDESLQASLQELARLKGLTEELLALSKAESPANSVRAPLIEPFRCIRRIIDDFSMMHANFTFEVDIRGDAGLKSPISKDHWKQAVLIVLDNAVKYSGDSRLIRIKGFSDTGGCMVLEISDYGIGIPQQELSRVFERFYRVDKARSRGQGGSGLGLAIAKRLMNRYSGSIAISSQENRGTTVTLSLPGQATL